MVKEICHVCKKEKKPYTVFLKNDIFSLLKYEQSREDGAICERCDRYFAMTGDFKNASEEEFEIAKKSVWFANMLLKWWEKDEKMSEDKDNKRDWEGTEIIAKWCRNALSSNSATQVSKADGFNRNLQVTPSASPKEATLPSVNSDIMFNRKELLQ